MIVDLVMPGAVSIAETLPDPFARPARPATPEVGRDQPSELIGAGHVVSSIFDQLSVGVVLLDGSARVLFANAAARTLAEKGVALRLNASVTSLSSEHARQLGDLVRSVLNDAVARTMSLPSSGNGPPLLVLAAPVQGADRARPDIRTMKAASAMLLICDPDRPAQVPAAWMMDAYGLTLAEVRVALAISSGATIASAARRLKISVNTVKTHLRRVYEKTGTSRQAALSRLMATISLARAGGPGV